MAVFGLPNETLPLSSTASHPKPVRAPAAIRGWGRHRRPRILFKRAMATMADLDRLALALPKTTKEVSDDGRPTYLVHGKMFCFHRRRRPDAVDPQSGERLDDVLVFRVADLDVKELLLSDPRRLFFTTPHWKGSAAVLMRIPDLRRIDREELRELVVDAWL